MLWKLIEVKKFHTNFHDVLERGGGGWGVGEGWKHSVETFFRELFFEQIELNNLNKTNRPKAKRL